MKSFRTLLPLFLLSISTMAFAQSDAHKHAATQSDAPKSDAQKSFDQLKTLAGTWHATVTTDPPVKEMGNGAMGDVTLRVIMGSDDRSFGRGRSRYPPGGNRRTCSTNA